MAIKIKHTNPSLNEFATDDLIVNINEGALFFKSNTKLFRIQGDNILTTGSLESGIFYEGMDLFPPTIKREKQQANQITTKTYWVDNEDVKADVHIGAQVELSSNNPVYPRLAIQPPGHTGGPFVAYARDDASSAYLDWYYGLTTDNHIMTFKYTGNVGIGTNNPQSLLHVSSSSSPVATIQGTTPPQFEIKYSDTHYMTISNQGFFVLADGGSTNNVFKFTRGSDEQMKIDPNGQLIVSGDISGSGDLILKSSTSKIQTIDTTNNYVVELLGGGGPRVNFGDTDSSTNTFMILGAFSSINQIDTKNRDFHLYGTNTTTGFYFDESAGTFGIGTKSPDTLLHLSGSNPALFIESKGSSNDSTIHLRQAGSPTAGAGCATGVDLVYDGGADYFYIKGHTNSSGFEGNSVAIKPEAPSNSFVINASGDIGMGTNSIGAKLHLAGVAVSGDYIQFDESAFIRKLTNQEGLLIKCDSSMILHAGDHGNVVTGSIISSTTTETLHLTADGVVKVKTGMQGTSYESTFDTSGGLTLGSGATVTSDRRLKKDIHVLTSSLDIVKQLEGVSYTWLDNRYGDRKEYGLIAQDVEKVIPKFTVENDEGYKTLNYSSIIPFLIESIKEQQQQIDNLKAKSNVK